MGRSPPSSGLVATSALAPTKRMTFVIDTDRTVIDVIKSEVRMGVHGDRSLQVLKDRNAV